MHPVLDRITERRPEYDPPPFGLSLEETRSPATMRAFIARAAPLVDRAFAHVGDGGASASGGGFNQSKQ
jgi:hypothetical protein